MRRQRLMMPDAAAMRSANAWPRLRPKFVPMAGVSELVQVEGAVVPNSQCVPSGELALRVQW